MVIENKPITPKDSESRHPPPDLQDRMVPVLCGSAFAKRGVQPLVDAVIDYLPSPLDVPPPRHGSRTPEDVRGSAFRRQRQVLFAGFQALDRSYVGKLVFFRVYSGQLKKGDIIYNPRTRKRERVSRVMMIQADKRIDVETTFAGRHRRAGRAQEHHHRRYACATRISTSCSNRRPSPNRSSRWR
jgi:elongation factor G